MRSSTGFNAGRAKGPAEQHLRRLDSVFGPEYFERGRLLITVARDLHGLMKVAHKLQAKVNESVGKVVEVIMEHVKHEWWMKLHETTTTAGLYKGQEVQDAQVTHIPEGIRVHPYKRDRMPTLEVLLLWEDISGATRGHCLYTIAHPETPTLEQVDGIFEEIKPYFAKRWISVELRLAPPIRGEFEEFNRDVVAGPADETAVGAGVGVTILSCHAYGFARNTEEEVAHVTACQPVVFEGLTDTAGCAKLCFLPADVNKIQVAETESFHGTEVLLEKSKMQAVGDGPTVVRVALTPKALAMITVHVFELPRKLPAGDDTDGIIDWASETRQGLPGASVEVRKDGQAPLQLSHHGDGVFVADAGGLPEGCVDLVASCSGYEDEERPLFLLVGTNEFYVPLRKARA